MQPDAHVSSSCSLSSAHAFPPACVLSVALWRLMLYGWLQSYWLHDPGWHLSYQPARYNVTYIVSKWLMSWLSCLYSKMHVHIRIQKLDGNFCNKTCSRNNIVYNKWGICCLLSWYSYKTFKPFPSTVMWILLHCDFILTILHITSIHIFVKYLCYEIISHINCLYIYAQHPFDISLQNIWVLNTEKILLQYNALFSGVTQLTMLELRYGYRIKDTAMNKHLSQCSVDQNGCPERLQLEINNNFLNNMRIYIVQWKK